MSRFDSCMYFGEVVHQRVSPRAHRLRYRVFQNLFDIDELPRLDGKLRLFSHNGTNFLAFHDSDHGDGAGTLRTYVENLLKQTGRPADGGRIALLCMPRIFGFVFNPLSIYYCYSRRDELHTIIYEVNNTFGERHSYLIPVESVTSGQIKQACGKKFYVSPFMDMDMSYEFTLTLPGETLATSINGSHADGSPMIFAAFTGVRRELSDSTLLRALVTYPFLTLGVVAAIHWEAAKLFTKGLRFRRRPLPPHAPVTVGMTPASASDQPLRAKAGSYIHKIDKQSA